MRFKTGFVVGCAAGFYLTQKARSLAAPLNGRDRQSASGADWQPRHDGILVSEVRVEKVRALGDLARERATDLLRGPVGDLARERVIALFEGAVASQRAGAGRGS